MDYIEIRSFDNYIEANIVLNMLLHAHINCHLKDENIVTIDPFLSPAIGGIKLMVFHSQVERAMELMKEAEKAYLAGIACPVCKAHKLESVSITRKHRCKLAGLASMLLNGHSLEVTRIYRCASCGYDFKELPVK
ncbi:MAG TPA: DUF2007 domain-containing protein [Flavisolibacter sp.]|nr:DUF2007 domain-containing protein [Flavisolibacter sp.]